MPAKNLYGVFMFNCGISGDCRFFTEKSDGKSAGKSDSNQDISAENRSVAPIGLTQGQVTALLQQHIKNVSQRLQLIGFCKTCAEPPGLVFGYC